MSVLCSWGRAVDYLESTELENESIALFRIRATQIHQFRNMKLQFEMDAVHSPSH